MGKENTKAKMSNNENGETLLFDEHDTHHNYEPPKSRGWEGGDLEITHQREYAKSSSQIDYAAVDMTQFHNTEVGKGYQAKHVVRQKTVPNNTPTRNIASISKEH